MGGDGGERRQRWLALVAGTRWRALQRWIGDSLPILDRSDRKYLGVSCWLGRWWWTGGGWWIRIGDESYDPVLAESGLIGLIAGFGPASGDSRVSSNARFADGHVLSEPLPRWRLGNGDASIHFLSDLTEPLSQNGDGIDWLVMLPTCFVTHSAYAVPVEYRISSGWPQRAKRKGPNKDLFRLISTPLACLSPNAHHNH